MGHFGKRKSAFTLLARKTAVKMNFVAEAQYFRD